MVAGANALSRVVVLFTAISLAFFLLLASRVQAGSGPGQVTTYVVQAGDTLWQIAQELGPEGDIRETIYEIKRLNGLTRSGLLQGERLLIPAGDTAGLDS